MVIAAAASNFSPREEFSSPSCENAKITKDSPVKFLARTTNLINSELLFKTKWMFPFGSALTESIFDQRSGSCSCSCSAVLWHSRCFPGKTSLVSGRRYFSRNGVIYDWETRRRNQINNNASRYRPHELRKTDVIAFFLVIPSRSIKLFNVPPPTAQVTTFGIFPPRNGREFVRCASAT